MEYGIGIGKKIGANYIKGIESVGGVLYFEEDGLTFKSHPFNIQRGTTHIKYSEIDYASRSKIPVPSFASVFSKEGKKHEFVLPFKVRDEFIDFINSMVQRQINTPPSTPPTQQTTGNSSVISAPTDKAQKLKENKKC